MGVDEPGTSRSAAIWPGEETSNEEINCHALGMVVCEILSECTPFATNDSLTVLHRVLDGERPERPQGEMGIVFTVNTAWDPPQADD